MDETPRMVQRPIVITSNQRHNLGLIALLIWHNHVGLRTIRGVSSIGLLCCGSANDLHFESVLMWYSCL